MSFLEISKVGIEFNTESGVFRALEDVSIKIKKGEFITLIGHSGCGKSTVLNIVAGLLNSTEGGVILNGKDVYENVELAVKQVFRNRKSKQEMKEWIVHNLRLVHMEHALSKMPHEISGGMKQRVGIARCLAMQPEVLLMDEPFGALDALTRAHLQDSLMDIHSDLGCCVIMITHDVDEAVLLSDRIVMMTNGPSATIGEIVEVDLARPRRRLALAENQHFNQLRQKVLTFLYDKQKFPSIGPASSSQTANAKAASQERVA
jgi:nitrate/nitrite transport system ATP-binding protein